MHKALRSLDGPAYTVEPTGKREGHALAQSWREAFVPEVKEATGSWTHKGLDWHAFSYGYAPALSGDKAHNAYRGVCADSYLVFVGQTLDACFRVSGAKPDFSGKRVDVYITTEAFEWTMVFTHEDGWYGPYFATARSH